MIPAKKLANVIPGVIGAGGAALALSGLILTASTAVPIGAVMQFSGPDGVAAFFGPVSAEASQAAIYFAGFTNSTAKPGNLLFSQYPTAPVSAYLRGASLAAMTLAQLQATPAGTLTVTVDGVAKTTSSVNLSTATSFSNAATLIAAAFTTGPAVSYDAQRQAFVVTSGTTGATSTVSFGSGTLAAALGLTQAKGAVTSQGAVASTPAAAMDAIAAKALNWATFSTIFEPVLADKIAFGTWASQQVDRFAYVCWDTDVNATAAGNTTAFGPQAAALALEGCIPLTADTNVAAALGMTMQALVQPLAAFVQGYFASLDFTKKDGRTILGYRTAPGLLAGVEDSTVADNLKTNGYNFYGDYATSLGANAMMQPGQISGRFKWADTFANEVWLNSNFQQNVLAYLMNVGSIPYNNDGYAAIETVLQDPINKAINFGAIRVGVTLSATQTAAVNAAAGQAIDNVLESRGWYLSIKDPGASARIARSSPAITFYYCDGGSVQQMTMSSVAVQ